MENTILVVVPGGEYVEPETEDVKTESAVVLKKVEEKIGGDYVDPDPEAKYVVLKEVEKKTGGENGEPDEDPSNFKKTEKQLYSCPYECPYQDFRKYAIISHIDSIHKGIRYPCEKCDHKAVTKQRLQHHIDSKHELSLLHL